MTGRGARIFVLGIVTGGVAAVLLVGGAAAAWGWRAGAAAHGHEVIALPAQPAQGIPFNPKEFIPVPNPGSCQNCASVACENVTMGGSTGTCNVTCPSTPVDCSGSTSDGWAAEVIVDI